jgi:hypothetical protein
LYGLNYGEAIGMYSPVTIRPQKPGSSTQIRVKLLYPSLLPLCSASKQLPLPSSPCPCIMQRARVSSPIGGSLNPLSSTLGSDRYNPPSPSRKAGLEDIFRSPHMVCTGTLLAFAVANAERLLVLRQVVPNRAGRLTMARTPIFRQLEELV